MKITPLALLFGPSRSTKPFDQQVLMPNAWWCSAVGLTCLLTPFRGWPADCASTPPGLVAWWPGEGVANDIAGTNHGTLAGSVTFASGEVGQSFSFDGSNQCVQIPYSPSFVGLRYSVELWTKPLSQVVDVFDQDFIFGQTVGRCQLVVRTGTSGVRVAFGFGTSNSTFCYVQSVNEIPIGQFSHLVGTWDGTTLRLYINGVLNAQSTPGATPVDSGCPFYIGGVYSPPLGGSCWYIGQFFTGLIDEVSFFNRVLSDDEIQAIYIAGNAGKCPEPWIWAQPLSQVGYWGKSVTFTVTAAGTAPLSYQWQKDGVPIAEATSSSLGLTNLQMTNAGYYSVIVTNSLSSTTSSNAYLTMNPAGVSLALYSGITIDGVVGLTYGIQYSTDLSDTNSWIGVTNITLTMPTQLWHDCEPARLPQRYYRVVPGPITIP